LDKIKEIYKDDFADYLLCLALDVGEGMLRNGGEISRVEDTIERICHAYGAVHVEVFTIISMINAAVRMPDGSYSSQLRRVRKTDNNFSTLEAFNALSREICIKKPPLAELDDMIHEVKRSSRYPKWVGYLASSIAASTFTLFFGGTLKDAAITFILGAVIAVINKTMPDKVNAMAKTAVSAFISTILAIFSVRLGIGDGLDTIMMGVIMLLVPGVSFGMAFRDLMYGDLLTGTMKTVQAVIQAVMIAFGYIMAVSLFAIAEGGII
jgi:uncharacterized membrane protein YjjP (DUF1212 family)